MTDAQPQPTQPLRMTIEEILARDGSITYRTRGTSMEPLLRQGRDTVTVRARRPDERFGPGDVVLYYRAGDRRHTLHRVVRVEPQGYAIQGDNCLGLETGVPFDDVLGVMVSFMRRGKARTTDDLWYRAYTRTVGIRHALLRARYAVVRLVSKLGAPGLAPGSRPSCTTPRSRGRRNDPGPA